MAGMERLVLIRMPSVFAKLVIRLNGFGVDGGDAYAADSQQRVLQYFCPVL